MSHNLSARQRPVTHHTPQDTCRYAQCLGAAAEALRIALDAGISSEQIREDAPFIPVVARAMEALDAPAEHEGLAVVR